MSRGINLKDDKLGGKPFLEGTRIKVNDIVVKYEKLGYSVDELLEAYPELDRSDIHTALAYYYSKSDEMESIDEADAKPA